MPPSSKLTVYGFLDLKLLDNSPRTKLATAEGPRSVSLRIEYSCTLACMYSANWTEHDRSAVFVHEQDEGTIYQYRQLLRKMP